jgi:polyisoprenoid-binding protein YceI
MKTFAASLVLTLPLLFVSQALAQHQTFTVNPDSSEVKMTLKTNHDIVNGTFHVQAGAIEYDRAGPNISGSVVVGADTGKTGNDSRDKKMDKDVLKVQQYTTVSFTPKSFTGTIAAAGDSTIQVTGTLTLLGAPHDISVPMQIHIEGGRCTAKGHFEIPYVQWGLKDPSFMVWKAEKVVDIDLNLVGSLSS